MLLNGICSSISIHLFENFKYKERVLLLAGFCLLVVHPAHGHEDTRWQPQSLEYTSQTGDKTFNCSGCHNIEKVPDLKMTVPATVSHDATSAPVSLVGFEKYMVGRNLVDGNKLAAWRYQIEGGTQGALVSNVRSPSNDKTIFFDKTEDPIVVRYCLVDSHNNDRNWNCEKRTINRDPKPNEAPEITSVTPDDFSVVKNSDPFEFTVTASDDSPSAPAITVASSNSAAVTVDSINAPTFALTFVGEGEALITIKASDGDLFTDETFEVTVNPSTTVGPPVITLPPIIDPPVVIPPVITIPPIVDPPVIGPPIIVIPPIIDPPVIGPPVIVDPPTVNLPPALSFDGVIDGAIDLSVGDIFSLGLSISDEAIETVEFETQSSNQAVATASFTSSPPTLTIDSFSAGSATITLKATDVGSLSTSLSVDVIVASDNAAPVAQPDEFFITNKDTVFVLDVLFNDTDIDNDNNELSIVLDAANSSQGNTIVVNGNEVSYQAAGVLSTEDSFSYRAQDPAGNLSASVNVTLTPSDQDGDGVVDALDNCPLLSNPNQSDMDTDSEGDLCDVDPDGNGIPGTDGLPFESGRELVEKDCLSCHLSGAAGAPRFKDAAAWDARIQAAGGEPEDLLGSVLNGVGAMQGFGDQYSTQELLQAIRYLTGREEDGSAGGTPGTGIEDLDLDGVADDVDNCPAVPNPDQINSDGVGGGDACDLLADQDGDGFPFALDDDDSNASRLIATLPVANGTVFTIDQGVLSLGRVARAVAQSNEYAKAAIILSDAEFSQGAAQVFAGVSIADDTQFSSLMGVINIDAQTTAGEAEIIVQLSSNLPLNPAMRVFDANSGSWSHYLVGSVDQLASAPATSSGCPDSSSANYRAGLIAGMPCVRVNVQDGGANDADASNDGRAELIVNIARELEAGVVVDPPTVVTNPSKGGGGGGSLWIPLLILLSGLFQLVNRVSGLRQ